MNVPRERLRIAMVVGTLGQGGAEKQLTYMARALHQAGIEVRVYCLTRGEFYEVVLQAMGLTPIWIGRRTNPLARVAELAIALREFRPHIVQSTHFYTNLYTVLSGRICGAIALGTIRSDGLRDIAINGKWGPLLMSMPPVLIANSYAAKRNAESLNVKSDSIYVVPNVIDLATFDRSIDQDMIQAVHLDQLVAVAVGTLRHPKRLDRFLSALAVARQEIPHLQGWLIGDGPEQSYLEQQAGSLGLLPEGLSFLGRRNEIATLLYQASMLVLSSEQEGFPNVLLEAMAARLPVVTTAVGDAGVVVQDGITGYVLPFDDVGAMAKRIARLAESPDLRHRLGQAGRHRVEQFYSFEGLGDRLLSTYRSIAERRHDERLLRVLRT